MYFPEGVAILNCFGGQRNVFFRGGRKFVLFVDKTMHVFARGGGNFELFWWTKKRVFQRGGFVVFFVNKDTHVFARGGGNFEVLCRKGNLLFRGGCMYLSEGGNFELFWWKKRHVVHRGGNYVLLVSKNMHVFARGGGNFEFSSCKHERMFQRAWQVCFVS